MPQNNNFVVFTQYWLTAPKAAGPSRRHAAVSGMGPAVVNVNVSAAHFGCPSVNPEYTDTVHEGPDCWKQMIGRNHAWAWEPALTPIGEAGILAGGCWLLVVLPAHDARSYCFALLVGLGGSAHWSSPWRADAHPFLVQNDLAARAPHLRLCWASHSL